MAKFKARQFREGFELELAVARSALLEMEEYATGGFRSDHVYMRNVESGFVASLASLQTRLCAALEFCSLLRLLESLHADYLVAGKEGLTRWVDDGFEQDFYSPQLRVLERYAKALFAATGAESSRSDKLSLLEAQLDQTPNLMQRSNAEPNNEADVRRVIYSHLCFIFPDCVRELPFPKAGKTYKADIGIKSLRTAIEYKYAASEKEAIDVLDGIFTDRHGYAGSRDWNRFYAVLYQTGHWLSKQQLQERWRDGEMPSNWHLIPVYGIGVRSKKTSPGP